MNEKAMDHPSEALAFISSLTDEKFIVECLPQVDILVKKGEAVSMRKVREWLISKYGLL